MSAVYGVLRVSLDASGSTKTTPTTIPTGSLADVQRALRVVTDSLLASDVYGDNDQVGTAEGLDHAIRELVGPSEGIMTWQDDAAGQTIGYPTDWTATYHDINVSVTPDSIYVIVEVEA